MRPPLLKLEERLNNLSADISTLSGAELSQIYCGSCHMMPDPQLLDKESWKHSVLPNMAYRLGITSPAASPYKRLSFNDQILLIKANIYASKPLIDSTNWIKIQDFYLNNAPDSVSLSGRPYPLLATDLFHLKNFNDTPDDKPMTTMVHIDETNQRVYAGSGMNRLDIFTYTGEKESSYSFSSPPVNMHIDKNHIKLLTMGKMHPSDEKKGILFLVDDLANPVSLIDTLSRAVDAAYGDLNGNQLIDIVVCEFGHNVGALTWHENLEDNLYKKHVLSSEPGAIKAYIEDFNNDQLPDILVLMAQGAERIDLYTNLGGNQFEVETLMRFPPIYGSLYFELCDFNDDGYLDILYTNGDNADYSPSPKQYHGIRIFENDGNMTFTQKYFFPMYGATKAMARDYDQDGDLDIVAISFFPEYDIAPKESIIYLENLPSPYVFSPSTIAQSQVGHWLVMDSGDIDNDGDEDILIGSYVFGAGAPNPLTEQWESESRNIVVLENTLKGF